MGSSGTIDAAKVAERERQLAVFEAARIAAEAHLVASETARARSEEALARLERVIAQLRRETFGAKSEKASPDQQHLPFEERDLVRH